MAEKKAKSAKTAKKLKASPRKAKGAGKKSCSMKDCKRAYRAKGYCFFHYRQWRRGELAHGRYKTCHAADCRKKLFKAGLCESHFNEKRSGKAAPAAAAAAPAAAAPAA